MQAAMIGVAVLACIVAGVVVCGQLGQLLAWAGQLEAKRSPRVRRWRSRHVEQLLARHSRLPPDCGSTFRHSRDDRR